MNDPDQLMRENSSLRRELESCRQDAAALSAELVERKKEYTCLAEIIALDSRKTSSLEEVLSSAVRILPSGWLYPEITEVRIRCMDEVRTSPGFVESPWRMRADLLCGEQSRGFVEIAYTAERPERDEGPFLKEERMLLEVVALRLSRMIELILLEEDLKSSSDELERSGQMFSSIFDGINEVIYIADMDTYEVLYMNKAMEDIFGGRKGEICYKVLQNRESPCPFCTNDIIRGPKLGQSHIWEFQNTVNRNWYRCIDKAIPWVDGRVVRYEMAIDVTQIKEAEQELQRQAQAILEMSTPVIRIWEGVVVAPVIGTMDPRRVEQFMDRLLTGIASTQSPLAIIDITGVPEVDTMTAQALIDSISASRMLGAEVVITGIRPAIAATMARLGIDMQGLETRSTLAQGLELALAKSGLAVKPSGASKENAR